jgi:FPC/CPF motif-containing protein YcgG
MHLRRSAEEELALQVVDEERFRALLARQALAHDAIAATVAPAVRSLRALLQL